MRRALLAGAALTLLAGVAPSAARPGPVPAPAVVLTGRATRLANGLLRYANPWGGYTVYDPYKGMVVATSSAEDASGDGGGYNDGRHTDDPFRVQGRFDSRLSGGLRSKFYRPVRPVTGTGRIEAVAGGACDGAGPLDVPVDPATVRVDRAGRVFWIDENDNAHFKGLPYVRVLGLDGKVRTLGNVGGPLEGRFWREGGGAGMVKIVPDEQGGVYFDYLGWFSMKYRGFWEDVTDDLPATTVIGHLKADGTNEFVSGRYTGDYSPSGNYDWVAPNGDGGPYADASFNYLYAMTFDAEDNVYVVDGNMPQSTGTGAGAPTNGRISSTRPAPSGTVDSRPVVVRFLNRSRHDVTFYRGTSDELTVKAGSVATVAGVAPKPTAVTDPAPDPANKDARTGQLVSAPGIVVDAEGNVLLLQLADGAVQVVAVNTGGAARDILGTTVKAATFATVAGTQQGYGGDGGKAVKALFDVRQANHWWFGDLVLDPRGGLVLADTVNDRVRRIDPHGIVTTLVGDGTNGFNGDGRTGPATALAYPMGVAVAGDGDVLVADWLNARIRRLDAATGRVATVIGNGSPMECGDGGAARTGTGYLDGAGLGQVHDAVTDSKGNTYLADIGLGVVRKVAPDGTITTVAGQPLPCTSSPPSGQGYLASCDAPQPSGDGGPPERAVLMAPAFLVVDRYDNLYVSDTSSVRYLNFRSTALKVQGIDVAPHTIETVYQGDVEARKTLSPVVPGGTPVELTTLVGLSGIALDEKGTLYIADQLHAQVWAKTWCGFVSVVAGNGVPSSYGGAFGLSDHNERGDGGPALAGSVLPNGLGYDKDRGLLFIADAVDTRVRVVNLRAFPVTVPDGALQPGTIDTFAGGSPCSGSFSCTYGDGNQATEAAMMAPYGVSAQPGGRVFIADGMGALVRVVERDGTIGTLAGVTPQTNQTDVNNAFIYWYGGICGEGGIAHQACLSGPLAANVTPTGDVVIVDGGAARVQRVVDAVHAPLRPLVEALPNLGEQWDFTTPLRLHDPAGMHALNPTLTFDANGQAYVYATRMTNALGGIGCGLWRVRPNADGVGHDTSEFLGTPGAYGELGDVEVPLFSLSPAGPGACSLAVAPSGGNAVVPPVGAGQRMSYTSIEAGALIKTGASRDGGTLFTPSPTNAVTANLLVHHAWNAALDADNFGLAFCCTTVTNPAGQDEDAIGYATSIGGIEYVTKAPVVVGTTDSRPYSDIASRPLVARGTLLVPVLTIDCVSGPTRCADTSNFGETDVRLSVARSTDGGATWTRGGPAFGMACTYDAAGQTRFVADSYCQGYHGAPQVVADAAGTLYAVFDDQRHVYLAVSSDLGQTWSTPQRLDQGLTVAGYPSIVAGVGGAVDVAFLGTTSPAVDMAARDAEWSVYLTQSLAAGDPAALWHQTVADPRAVHRQYLGVPSETGTWANYGEFLRVAIDPRDGRAMIAYQEDRGEAGHDTESGIVVTRQCSGRGLLGDKPFVPCAAGLVAGAVASAVAVVCPDQVRDPAGDASYGGAAVASGDVRSAGIGLDSGDLVARLAISSLSYTPPAGTGGQSWTVLWDAPKGTFFLRAEAGPAAGVSGAAVAYSYGVVTPSGALSKTGTATGRVDGNTLTVWAPAGVVGSAGAAPLHGIRAMTEVLEKGIPEAASSLPTARWERVDSAAATDGYARRLACPAMPHVAPPSPVPAASPAVVPPVAAPVATVAPVSPVVVGPPSVALAPAVVVPAARRAVPVARPFVVPPVAAPARAPGPVAPVPAAVRAAPVVPPLRVAMLAAPPLVPCSGTPPTIPDEPAPAPPAPVPAPPPVAHVQPPAVAGPPEPPVQPAGPAPGPAPAPQPQAQPGTQPGAQHQLGTQHQPGAQVGVAGAVEVEHREARAYTASRRTAVPAAAWAWAWTCATVSAVGAVGYARRRPAYATVRRRS